MFTSKQILVQAGVSMLAQANQAPQNLLRLFQQ
ncbi:MAG: flagellin, partial [Alphaproteobacteria bacterium]